MAKECEEETSGLGAQISIAGGLNSMTFKQKRSIWKTNWKNESRCDALIERLVRTEKNNFENEF
jgi:hypothetical protein